VHVRWSSSFSVKQNPFLRTSGPRIVLNGKMQEHVYQTPIRDIPIWDSAWSTHGIACRRALWTMLLTNGGKDSRPMWMKKEDILNTCCSNWTRTRCVDKRDVVLDCATVMCNFGWYDWKLSLCTWLVSKVM